MGLPATKPLASVYHANHGDVIARNGSRESCRGTTVLPGAGASKSRKKIRFTPVATICRTLSTVYGSENRHRTAWQSFFRAASLLAVIWAVFAVPAAARELKIQKFSAEVFVQQDSALNVTETIDVNFIGSWHGFYRSIPIEYVTPQGFNYSLFVKFDGATDAAGQPLKVESSRERHYLKWKIYVDDANDAVRTIVLHYRVANGLKYFEDHDELYWNVTGDEWEVPIENASAQILLPPGITGIRALAFTGSYGSRAQNADVVTSDNTVNVSMLRPLAFHEGLTVVVGWDKGFVKEPATSDLVNQFLASNWPLFFPVPIFLFMFWLWYTRGRDPRLGPVAVQRALGHTDDLEEARVVTHAELCAASDDRRVAHHFKLERLARHKSRIERTFHRSLKELKASYYCFIKCRPSLVAQFNMVANFGGRGELLSLYAPYVCGACGEEIVVTLDASAGESQTYTEDCPVCCRPNVIHVELDDDGSARVWAELE